MPERESSQLNCSRLHGMFHFGRLSEYLTGHFTLKCTFVFTIGRGTCLLRVVDLEMRLSKPEAEGNRKPREQSAIAVSLLHLQPFTLLFCEFSEYR